MGITGGFFSKGGDMKKTDYDPNCDGVIAVAQTEADTLKIIPFGKEIGINENTVCGTISYKNWFVVGYGFSVGGTPGVNTEDPEIEFGIAWGDLGYDTDAFGSVKQDAGAGLNFIQNDVWIKDPYNVLATPAALGMGGTPTWDAGGARLGIWYTEAQSFIVTRPNDHALSVVPFIAIIVKK